MEKILRFLGPMIENIVVICQSKDDKQQWIDLLKQDSSSSALQSPSSTAHHVSCTHLPYSRLSRLFARLVKKKIVNSELLKRLLYFEYLFKPDMSTDVKMRKCISIYNIYPRALSDNIPTNQRTNRKPVMRKSSTLKLDVRYVVPGTRPQCPNSFSVAVMDSLNQTPPKPRPVQESCRSLPPGKSRSNIQANSDSGTTTSGIVELNTCNADIKNWKSINSCQKSPQKHLSPHSSDSGVGCQFRNSENFQTMPSESEPDENKFENQCICTSPFGSTPRHSSSSESCLILGSCKCSNSRDIRSEKNIIYNICDAYESDEDDEDEDDEEEEEEDDDMEEDSLSEDENCNCSQKWKQNERDEKWGGDQIRYRHMSQPCPSNATKIQPRRMVKPKTREALQPLLEENNSQTFTSGLYAHWWLKKTLPINITNDQGKLLWHG